MSIDFDIDDLFGDLDEIEQSIEDLNAESDLDRHDRLKMASIEADEAHATAAQRLDTVLSKHAPLVGIPSDQYRVEDRFCERAFQWSKKIDYWGAKHHLIEAAKKDEAPAFKPEITEDAQVEITEALDRYVSTLDLQTAANSAWKAAIPDFGTGNPDEDEDITFLTEGCYIRFSNKSKSKDRWGYETEGTEYVGYGEVIQITASNYIVKIDHNEIAKKERRVSRDHFAGKETARLVIAQCFAEAGEDKGGRSVQFLWGPTGNSKRAEMAAAEAKKKAAEQDRQQRAVNLRDAARAEWEQARTEEREHAVALQRVEHDAEQAALDILKAKYAKELASLTKAMRVGIEQGLAEYERPAILDNPPSNDWRQYLDKE